MKNEFRVGLSLLMLGALACQPVLAIGWGEFLILMVVITLLIGPPVYRLFRRLEKVRDKKRRSG